jgi:hypothetical protein
MNRYPTGCILISIGAACLVVVVLTHLAEAFHVLSAMRWGQPSSAGHYLDLVSAILGCILIPLGCAISYTERRHTKKRLRQ